jgi:predicted PurR-regulated permease PerM
VSHRREFERETSLDDTVRELPALSEEAGELKWRQQVNKSFEGVSEKLNRIEIRLTKIEERQLSRQTVAEIAQKEIAVLSSKLETLSRIVWGMGGAVGSAVVVIAATKLFK